MKYFVFKVEGISDYEVVTSESMEQAEKETGRKCVAAFMYKEDADGFVYEYNNMWR